MKEPIESDCYLGAWDRVVEIAYMGERVGLFGNGFGYDWMAVAEARNSQAAEEVEVAPTFA